MTSEPSARPGFPIGLTITVAVSMAILIALGVWQLKRLAWKTAMLAHIEALKTSPAQPLGPVLARHAKGADVEWTRVSVTCEPLAAPTPSRTRYALRDGKIIWRAETPCFLAAGPYSQITIDRGYLESSAGQMEATAPALPPPGAVVGVLRNLEPNKADLAAEAATTRMAGAPAPVLGLTVVAEREAPAPPGVTPSALPADIPNNHLSYAFTWFGIAAALAGVYAAMLFRRLKPART